MAGDSVPAIPPDSVPLALQDARLVTDASLQYYPHIVVVAFDEGASVKQRTHAIALINGKVVGGIPDGAGGLYLVQIAADSTSTELFRAIKTLKELPAVSAAGPYMLASPF